MQLFTDVWSCKGSTSESQTIKVTSVKEIVHTEQVTFLIAFQSKRNCDKEVIFRQHIPEYYIGGNYKAWTKNVYQQIDRRNEVHRKNSNRSFRIVGDLATVTILLQEETSKGTSMGQTGSDDPRHIQKKLGRIEISSIKEAFTK